MTDISFTPDTLALRAVDVKKQFGPVKAVDGISLEIPRGHIVALLGKNGAGKSTFIDIALGLQRATSGHVELFGMSPREAIRRSLVGVVQQSGALMNNYTVEQTLRLFSALHPQAMDYERVMEETGLSALRKRNVGKLSGGECQRLRLALALIPHPHLLILDEPTAGMDTTARREFWQLMHAQAHRGRTIIFATHYLAEVEDFSERTIILRQGVIVSDTSTHDLRRIGQTRTLHARVPKEYKDTVGDILARLPQSQTFTVRWDCAGDMCDLIVHAPSTDDIARHILTVHGVRDLEISTPSLDDTFARLTA
ncbi:ABC transporter ATP-binding protein [Schaalia sp. lx-260]|uniref:ABC transporter ATP-binding protein n=1 Tax=Schaalia sp. lx-260 TaxID=2899082 RepID=UPI001E5A1097|nr:ABC transporter ATP-binding protein [Schaalia sp. lx-260]MCD4550119.1 ABC transporter ATP-binding protein [Schaalia sp. lx-260]